jgi:tetratricopeptide (TPR) repeat protein
MRRRHEFSPKHDNLFHPTFCDHFNQPNRFTCKGCILALFLALLASFPIQLAAANEGGPAKRIRGVLTTLDGKPLSGATVEISDYAGSQIAKSITDSEGRFEILTDAMAGEYELIVTNSGQLNDEQVRLGRTDLDVKLAVSAAESKLDQAPYSISARQLSVSAKARARIGAAQKKFEKGDISAAMIDLDAAMRLSPTCSEAWSMRAFMKLATRDSDGAIRDASHAADLDRDNAEAYLALGSAHNARREFKTAETSLRRSLVLRPGSWQAQLELAKAWYGQKRFVLALRQLDLIQRDFPDVHLVRANILISVGRKRDGAEEFGTFLRAVPGDRRAPQIRRILAEMFPNHLAGQ